MTTIEAIDWCEQFRDNIIATGVEKEKYTLALNAMRKAITALEKQTLQKVIRYWEITYQAECPACNGIIEAHASHRYCRWCGQKLEWSVDNE